MDPVSTCPAATPERPIQVRRTVSVTRRLEAGPSPSQGLARRPRELVSCFFFFFQAEDGIRDWSVTGVKTCALPILEAHVPSPLGTRTGTWASTPPARVDTR